MAKRDVNPDKLEEIRRKTEELRKPEDPGLAILPEEPQPLDLPEAQVQQQQSQPTIQDSVQEPKTPQEGAITRWGVSEGEEEGKISSWADEDVADKPGAAQFASSADDIIMRRYRANIDKLKADAGQGARVLSAANLWAETVTKFFSSEPLKAVSLHTAWITNMFLENDIDPLEMSVYKAGQNLGKTLDQAFPDSPLYKDEFWAGTMAQASGQMTGQVLLTLATMGLGGGSGVVWTTNSLAQVGMSSQYYERAREAGASEEDAFSNMLANTAGSVALEALPMIAMARRLDKATGGGLKKLAKVGFKGSMEEGFTEAVQQYYTNAVDKVIYDKSRDLMEGVVESFAAGALLGGFTNITLTGLTNRGVQAESPEGIANTQDAMEMINREYSPIKVESQMDFIRSVEKQGDLAAQGITITKTGMGTPLTNKNHGDLNLWERGWRKFMSSAPQGEAIRNMSEYTAGVIKAQVGKALLLGNRVNQAILDYSGVKKPFGAKLGRKRNIAKAIRDGLVDKTLITRIDGVLRGEVNENSLPKELRQPVRDMRAHIDELSIDAVKAEISQGPLMVKFLEEVGTYLHRTYRLYDPQVEWGIDNIPENIWNKAVAHLRNQIKASDQYADNMSEIEITREAEGQLKELLERETEGSLKGIFLRNKKNIAADKGDMDVLMERQDIHPAIRKVMGEYTDPVHNYVTSIEKMSNTFYKRLMFDKMADQFAGKHFFTEKDLRGMDNSKEFRNKLDTGVGSKFDNMYMHEDMYKALTQVNDFSGHNPLLRALYTMNSVAKYSKTVLSHVTIARNVVGGSWFMGFNGLLFNNPIDTFKKGREAAKIAFKSLPKLDEEGLAQKRLEYDRLGLQGQNVFAQEFLASIADGYLNLDDPITGNYEYFIEGRKGKSLLDKARRKFSRGAEKAAQFYQKGDNFIRIFTYELEKARLQRADPSITDLEVAELVKDTYQNYGRLNKLTKSLRLAPIAPFLSFPAELVRTATNTSKRARLEMTSDKKAMRKVGYQRFAGMISTSVASLGLGAASMMLNNIDDEEDQAYRQLMPEWDRTATLAYVSGARDGHAKYINTSYTNPYGYIADPIFALARGESDESVLKRFATSFGDMIEPLMSEELFTKALREVASNKKAGGGEIWNPEDTIGDKAQKMYLHLWASVEPGSISSLQRFYSAVSDEEKSTKVSDEMLGLFGLRITDLDIKKSYGFRIRDFRQRIRNARRAYNSVKYDENSSETQRRQALERANSRYEEIFEEMKNITDAARKSGVDWYELKGIMEDSGLANRDVIAIRDGAFIPFED